MHTRKELKYGYAVENTGKNQLAKPSTLTRIVLTPTNSKFLLYGTKHEILKWMASHSELLVEYDPLGSEIELTPPSSPLYKEFLSSPTSTTPMSTSPTSPSYLSSPSSPSSPTSPVSPSTASIPSLFLSSDTDESPYNIVFDLFTAPTKASSLLSDEANKSLNVALKHIPWIEVMLEIRPADEYKDSKLHPINRVILPSGLSLSKISKVLEKSWKPTPTAFGTELFAKNNESNESISKSINSDNEESLSNKFMAGIAKHVPTVDLWLRQKQTTGPIPPGVLTPYIIDDVLGDLGDLGEEKRRENDKVLVDKKQEAEMDKELITDLPRYEAVFGDRLLERGN